MLPWANSGAKHDIFRYARVEDRSTLKLERREPLHHDFSKYFLAHPEVSSNRKWTPEPIDRSEWHQPPGQCYDAPRQKRLIFPTAIYKHRVPVPAQCHPGFSLIRRNLFLQPSPISHSQHHARWCLPLMKRGNASWWNQVHITSLYARTQSHRSPWRTFSVTVPDQQSTSLSWPFHQKHRSRQSHRFRCGPWAVNQPLDLLARRILPPTVSHPGGMKLGRSRVRTAFCSQVSISAARENFAQWSVHITTYPCAVFDCEFFGRNLMSRRGDGLPSRFTEGSCVINLCQKTTIKIGDVRLQKHKVKNRKLWNAAFLCLRVVYFGNSKWSRRVQFRND